MKLILDVNICFFLFVFPPSFSVHSGHNSYYEYNPSPQYEYFFHCIDNLKKL